MKKPAAKRSVPEEGVCISKERQEQSELHFDPVPLYALGDIHGELDKALALLRQIRLIDESNRWIGKHARLVCVGDYVDRGRQGIETLEMLRRLQEQAQKEGGRVVALLGNHDAIMIAHARGRDGSFADLMDRTPYWEIRENHLKNGGYAREVAALKENPSLLEWYAQLPVLHLEDDTLFGHGNIDYSSFGADISDVNAWFRNLMKTAQGGMEAFSKLTVRDWPADGRFDLDRDLRFPLTAAMGVRAQLETFGGSRYVHGHTPEQLTTRHPLNYADSKAYNIDHALCYHPELLGYVLELLPENRVRYHVGQPSAKKILERLWTRYLTENIPLKRVLVRDQITAQELSMGMEPSTVTASDVFDLECALEEIQTLLRVTEDADTEVTVRSLLEQLEQLSQTWMV